MARGVRQDRQREAYEAIGTELEQDRRQDHRAAGRRLGVRVRQPGVHRPHRHLHRESKQEAEEERDLHAQRQDGSGLVPVEDGEGAARLVVEVEERHQHEERAEQRVEEELDRGVHPVRATPDADDDEHRYQRAFEEDVEEHRVQRREDAVQQAGHDQEGGEVLLRARFNRRPAGDHHQYGDEAVQQDEEQRDAVDAQVVVDVEALDPAVQLDELHGAGGGIEAAVKRQGDEEADYRADERDPAHPRVALAHREHRYAGDDRNPDRERQEHASPISSA